MNRLSTYLRNQADVSRGRSPYPIKLTPGQIVELTAELGYEPKTFATKLGDHPVVKINSNTKATGDNVILSPRHDLFSPVEQDSGVILVCNENEVTNIPDNTACCEIISVGSLVSNVKVGDLVFADIYDVKQGFVLENETLFLAGSDVFKGMFKVDTQEVLPLNNYVVTKRSSARMSVALSGTDRVAVPPYILTDGIPGGKNSSGGISTHILYEEVVTAAKVTSRARPGVMTRVEREFLEACVNGYTEAEQMLSVLRDERERGYDPDVKKGDLVVFCKEVSTPIRVRGEFCHLIHIDNVLATINDQAILDASIRKGQSGQLIV